jgi:hypothetical protein
MADTVLWVSEDIEVWTIDDLSPVRIGKNCDHPATSHKLGSTTKETIKPWPASDNEIEEVAE